MKLLTFDESSFRIDGRPVYLNSGEFPYFRVPKADWKRRMELLKAAGGNALATYIPWSVHEPEEGKFVFDRGDGMTDLADFLECAREAGLYVIARPGPYVYSELTDHGLPHWLPERFPQILSQRRDGSHHGKGCVSYLHPDFLAKVHAWYAEVCPRIAKYTLKHGGPVAFVQLDNELAGIHVWFGDLDFNPGAMGFGQPDGRYPRFLREKYGTPAAANAAYGADRRAFADFSPADEPAAGPKKTRWDLDYAEFYDQTLTEFLGTLMRDAESAGIDCPFCHNAGTPAMNAMFRDAKRKFGRKFLLGSDHYYMLVQTMPQNSPTPQFLAYCFMSAELLRVMGNPPCVLENQYGSVAEWPPTMPEDIRVQLMCQLASGVRGHNGYVFTGGPNPPGLGTSCVVYDYDAPVGADGVCRPTYGAIREFGEFVKAHPELAVDRTDADLRVAVPWRALSGVSGTCDETRGFPLEKLRTVFQKGLLSGLFAAHLQCELCDLDAPGWETDFSTPLFIPCDGAMDAAFQRKIADFVRAGGNAVLWPVLPFMDEAGKACTLLTDAFGGAATGPKRADHRSQFVGHPEIGAATEGALFGAAKIPAGAAVLARSFPDGEVCTAWHLQAGRGSLAWFGMAAILQRRAHIEALRTMFEAAHGVARWRADNPWVMAFRRRLADGSRMIFLANAGTSRQEITPEIRQSDGSWRKLERIALAPMEIKVMRA